MMEFWYKNPIIIYDGSCKFCNYWVQFVLNRDHKKRFFFADSNSEIAKTLVSNKKVPAHEEDSIIVIYEDKVHILSDAVFIILSELKHPARWFWFVTPAIVRDAVYRFIAKNRHKIGFLQQACVIPNADQKTQFL